MKKKSYARPIALLVAVIGAYHVVLFGLHPRLPPVAKTEVVWGDLRDGGPSSSSSPLLDASLCVNERPMSEAKDASTAETLVNRARFEYRPEATNFVNTGNAAQIWMERGSTLTLGKKSYTLQQIQFRKSATTGQMAFWLVHRINGGKTVVVEVPLQLASQGNPTIDTLWRYLPQRPGEHNSLDDVHIDINKLLPQDRSFYRYAASGSCSKEVVVLGLTSPVQISANQVAKLDRVLGAQKSTTTL